MTQVYEQIVTVNIVIMYIVGSLPVSICSVDLGWC